MAPGEVLQPLLPALLSLPLRGQLDGREDGGAAQHVQHDQHRQQEEPRVVRVEATRAGAAAGAATRHPPPAGPGCRAATLRRGPAAAAGHHGAARQPNAGLRAPRSPAAASGAPGSRPAPSPPGQGEAPPLPARPRGGRASGCGASCGRGNRSSRPVPSRLAEPLSPNARRSGLPSPPVSYPFPAPAPSTSERGAGTGTARRLLPAGGGEAGPVAARPHPPPWPRGSAAWTAPTMASGEPRARGQLPPAPAAGRAGWQRAAAPRAPALRGSGAAPLPALRYPALGRGAPEATGPLRGTGHGTRQSLICPPTIETIKNYRPLPKEGTSFSTGLVTHCLPDKVLHLCAPALGSRREIV